MKKATYLVNFGLQTCSTSILMNVTYKIDSTNVFSALNDAKQKLFSELNKPVILDLSINKI